MKYGEQRAIAAIRKLPAATYTYEVRHDPVTGVADDGIPIKAKVTVDPRKGLITVTSDGMARGPAACRHGYVNCFAAGPLVSWPSQWRTSWPESAGP